MQNEFTRCRNYVSFSVVFGFVVSFLGCGAPDEVERFGVSGKVMLNGQPVTAALINWVPDRSKGNTGPGSFIIAENGRYQSDARNGILGGWYIVTITPVDPEGTRIPSFLPYETAVELPREQCVQDFNIPKS